MKLIPRSWSDFQHYKDRRPPWIKLHRTLIDSRQFQRLPLASRALAPMLWLLASESIDGTFDASLDELEYRLRQPRSEISDGLQPLVTAGFFDVIGDADSTVLAERQQVAVPEAEAEADGERDFSSGADQPPPTLAKQIPDCPHEAILALWAEKLPSAIQPADWNEKRQALLRSRWREKSNRQTLDWWGRFFDYIAQSDFLTGRSGDRPFQLSLDWLCKSENFLKVIEGRYENKAKEVAA